MIEELLCASPNPTFSPTSPLRDNETVCTVPIHVSPLPKARRARATSGYIHSPACPSPSRADGTDLTALVRARFSHDPARRVRFAQRRICSS
jgi:hypothetical protein